MASNLVSNRTGLDESLSLCCDAVEIENTVRCSRCKELTTFIAPCDDDCACADDPYFHDSVYGYFAN